MEIPYLAEVLLGFLPYVLAPLPFYMKHRGAEQWLVRKVMHILTNTLLVVYFVMITSVNVFISLLVFLVILFIISIIPGFEFMNRLVAISTREGEPEKKLLVNVLSSMFIILTILFIFIDSPHIFVPAILSLAWGDGLGEIIGRPYGRHKYKVFNNKSVEGSIGVFIGILLGGIVGFLIGGIDFQFWWVLLLVSTVGMLVEAVAMSFVDNLVLPTSVALLIFLIL
ncbi:MAG: hypothetical protein INQ03_04400 [Candidatus Heimdallarchaeota archaeon]|nr:hypothetical protein [Candidatus Heimdallarchaeota archaeon]